MFESTRRDELPDMKHPPNSAVLVGGEGGPSHGNRLLVARQELGEKRAGCATGRMRALRHLLQRLPPSQFPGRRRHTAMAGAAAEARGWQGEMQDGGYLRGEGGHVWFGVGALPPWERAPLRGAAAACLPVGIDGGPTAICLLLAHPVMAVPPALSHRGALCSANPWPCNGHKADFGWKRRLFLSEKHP